MKDIVEHYEACAEASYDRMVQPDGKLKCDCGRIFDPDAEGGPTSSNPYAMAVCGDCLEHFIKQLKENG